MRKIIIIEGASRCPRNVLKEFTEKKGYKLFSRTKYEKLKNQGVFQDSSRNIAAIFVGPRPHKTRNRGPDDLQSMDGTLTEEGIPMFICHICTQNYVVKVTKSSFIQAFERFEAWKLQQ